MKFFLPGSFRASHTMRRAPQMALWAAFVGVLLLGSSRGAQADSIGVNFNNNFPNSNLAAGTSAGVVPQTNFNNLAGVSGTSGALNDNNGAATTATVTYTAAFSDSFVASPAVGDEQFNNASIFANQGTPLTVTLNSIPYGRYDIYVYNLYITGANQQTTLGPTSFFSTSPNSSGAGYIDGNAATPYTYTQATSTSAANPTANANYVRFSGLSGASQSFSVTGLNGLSSVGGFQVVSAAPVPEPSTYAMMFLGVGALCLIARRKRNEIQQPDDFA